MARRTGRGLFRRRGKSEAGAGEESDEHVDSQPEQTAPFPAVEPTPESAQRTEKATGDEQVEAAPADPGATSGPERQQFADPGQLAEIRAMDEILALESDLERAKQQAAAEIESLRERLLVAEQRAEVAAALEAGMDPASVREQVRAKAEAEVRADLAARRAQLEVEIRKELGAEAEDRIAKFQADADERVRTEVGIARRAAEDHFREALAERELELENERAGKARLIEDSERRLAEIERKATAAASRVAAAEAKLAEKEAGLRQKAEAKLDAERERIRAEAAGDAGRRAEALRAELDRRSSEFERRIAELESELEIATSAGARQAEEMRVAAAAWIRGQAESLRRQGVVADEEQDHERRLQAAASRIEQAAAHAEEAADRASATGAHREEGSRKRATNDSGESS